VATNKTGATSSGSGSGPSPRRSTLSWLRQRTAILGPDLDGALQSLVALSLLALTAVVAGITLGHNTERLASLPGLLLMVPAAIALRGNVFGALGSRLGTAIHTGTFRMSARPGTVVGENILASLALSISVSLVLAVLAKGTAVAFGVTNSISLGEFIVVSVVGGFLASLAVLCVALLLAAGSVRYGWDPDNVTAPLVTAVGDLATVPALILATWFLGSALVTGLLAAAAALAAVVFVGLAWHRGRAGLRTVLAESFPVLIVAVILDLIAGISVEKRLDEFIELPRLLVLLPAYLAAAGALGGILSSRIATKLHLGTVRPSAIPGRGARPDFGATLVLAIPIFVMCAALAHVLGGLSGLAGPSLGRLLAAAVVGGLIATLVALLVAYYGTIAAVRFGLDPDTYGIPLVTAILDLVGAFTFVVAVESFGIV